MNCKKCKRCGCFFVSDNEVCPKCEPRDNFEITKLRNYLNSNEVFSFDELSYNVGIAPANLNRYISSEEFVNIYNKLNQKFNDENLNNIDISL